MEKFINRTEAGKKLAAKISSLSLSFDIVLALPRGGVPIAAELAINLNLPLNVYLSRKLGAPNNPEFGVGAIAEQGVILFDDFAIEHLQISDDMLNKIITDQELEMQRRIEKYRSNKPLPEIKGKNVLLVDDGVATGVTAMAAMQSVKTHNPATITFAVPVCSSTSINSINEIADNLVCLVSPTNMRAVGEYYEEFNQVSDKEVVDTLNSI